MDDELLIGLSIGGGIAFVVFLVILVFGIGFVVHRRRMRSRFEIGFDQNGLLMDDDNFEL